MLGDLLRRHCGLHYGPESRTLLESRVARRMRDLDLGSLSSYLYLLRKDAPGDGEFARLVDDVVTNETYFLRERAQLRALLTEILPERRLEHPSAAVRIWCAGCSSGEEPYSVVILGIEAGLVPGVDFHVYASDISHRMLRKARQGLYREASFRSTEPGLRRRYFSEKDGHWRISDSVKKHVDFIHLNLLDPWKVALLGTMDVVMCRNVIIYFDVETKRQVIETFRDRLRPGGHLLLGHSESLIDLSNAFELRHLKNDLVYRRPLPGVVPDDPWHAAASAAVRGVDGEESDR